MDDFEVARTIMAQLGGKGFALSTGARVLFAGDDFVEMSIGRNYRRINRLTVTLNGNDTYTMDFTYQFVSSKLGKIVTHTIKKYENVFCDQLQDLFEEATGMSLCFCRVQFG